jgi:tetratricopeptide (TPR) repeat protein
MVKNELGMNLCAQGRDLDRAEALVAEVLQARTDILGDEHAYTLWSVNDMAKILYERGRVEEAIERLTEIMPIVDRTLGEDHVGTPMTLGNLATAYGLNAEWEKAEATLERLLGRVPPDHPDRINIVLGFAKVRLRTGRIKEAEQDYRQLLATMSPLNRVGASNFQIASVVQMLMDIHSSRGEIEIAEDMKEQYKLVLNREINLPRWQRVVTHELKEKVTMEALDHP